MLSTEMIDAVRDGKELGTLKAQYEKLNPDSLTKYLSTDNEKKAFWINTYNAYIQILLTENPEYFDDRGDFFSKPKITAKPRLSSA